MCAHLIVRPVQPRVRHRSTQSPDPAARDHAHGDVMWALARLPFRGGYRARSGRLWIANGRAASLAGRTGWDRNLFDPVEGMPNAAGAAEAVVIDGTSGSCYLGGALVEPSARREQRTIFDAP
jgi:hypothetical protein